MISVGISVVVPVYAGAETLSEMVREFSSIKREWENRFPQIELLEVVFVDDDSVDHSSAVLSGLETRHSWIRVLTLSRNFGQHPATVAGILTTSGEWVVTMDEDLQHPPSKIFDLLKTALDAGNDVVYAKSTVNVHDSFLRDWSSRFVKKLTSWLSGNQQVVDFSSFRLVRGSIARAAAAVSANETYFDVALSWFTSGIGTLSLELRDERFRQRRQSGYSLRRLISHARRLLISSQTKWLRLGAVLGVGALIFGVLISLFKLTQWLVDPQFVMVPGWISLFLGLMFFGGLNSLFLSIILEYLGVLVSRSLGKPTYFIVDRSSDKILLQAFEMDREREKALVTT